MEVITASGTAQVAGRADGEALWLSLDALEQATGWTMKPEGLCKDDICVPAPTGIVGDNAVDVAGFWRHLDRAVAHDGEVWVLGEAAAARAAALQGLKAEDFTLPDLAGRMHSLGAHAGKKILLTTWASW